MSDPHHIPAGEHGVVRVFTTDLEPEGDAAITAKNVHKVLGEGITLDAARVEVFPSKVIEGLGLSAYLREGYGVPEADLAGKAAALDAMSGLIILIPSSAFGGREQVLDPNPGLRFIGAFAEPRPAPPVQMAASASATGHISPRGTFVTDAGLRQRKGSWIIALGALIIAAALVLFAVF